MEPDRVRRSLPLVLGWLLAAVAALAVASWGVALVGSSVTDRRPAPLTASQVDERLDELATSTSTSTTSSAPSSVPGSEDEPTTSSSTPDESNGDGATTTTAPRTATTAQPSSATTTASPAAPPTTAAPAETRTYSLEGGTVTLRFEPGRVTVVFANPAQGFDVEVEPEHVNGVKVEFESPTHRSRVDGWWDGGPRDRVSERDDSDGDDSD